MSSRANRAGIRKRAVGIVRRNGVLRALSTVVALVVTAIILTPSVARAESANRIVRVGWFESPFNTTDELDRRSGYSYEYQQKIAAYAGWTYEYVEGSWPDLLQMLIEGKIDLLSDVSFTEERADKMLFSTLPMGAEEYFIFVKPGNEEISPENVSTFVGKTVGVSKGSIQLELFRQWVQASGAEPEIVELTGSEDENFTKLKRGTIDMYVTLDAVGAQAGAEPICKIGSSDFFFAVSNAQPELLTELNAAMYRIQDENQFFNQELASKYLQTSNANLFLSTDEKAWLAEHGTIRVGYQDNYLAFCATDPETGELTGALKDYLEAATDCLENAQLQFEAIAYPTAAAALDAVKRGEIDCMFPANLTNYDGEVQGFFMTAPVMSTDMSAVIREADQKTFAKQDHITVAVNVGNTNYDMFLLDHFPDWRSIYFTDTPECLKAIAAGKADCLFISNYRYNNIAALCEKYHLTTLSTGVEMEFYFAVNRSDTVLYSILNKVASAVPTSTVNAALTYYFTEDAKTSLVDKLRQNTMAAVGVFALVALLTICLSLLNVRRKRKNLQKQEDSE